jgi:dienelactone hydrolase
VKKEYPIDPNRTFLFGYSHGGSGSYYIGTKYAQNWAAIALGGAGNAPSADYPFDKLKSLSIPVMIYFGDQDTTGVKNNSPAFVTAMKEHGIDAQLKVYPGVNHDGGPAAAVGDAFEFFSSHPRKLSSPRDPLISPPPGS